MRVVPAIVMGCLALITSAARADSIGPAPEDCAPGSIPLATHGGEWCEDTTCTTDADCARWEGASYGSEADARFVCRRVSACVPPGTRPIGPQRADSPRGAFAIAGRVVHGACGAAGECAEGECEQARRCVAVALALDDEPELATRSPDRPAQPHTQQIRGGGCTVGAETSGFALTAVITAIAMLAYRARRR